MTNELAENLKTSRKKLGYTQQQIAEKLKITQSTYAGYETGRSTPNIEILRKIADIYDTSLDILTGRYIKN